MAGGDKFLLKVSLPGYDVQTASVEQCSIHSDYDTLKAKLDTQNPHYGRVDVTFINNPTVAGTFPIITINHGYDYLPFFYFFYSIKDSTKAVSAEVGNIFDNDVFGDLTFHAVPQEKKIVFKLIVSTSFILNTETVQGNTYSFRYFVFANDSVDP